MRRWQFPLAKRFRDIAGVCIAFAALAVVAAVQGQNSPSKDSAPENGKICGTVRDESDEPASNVQVIAMLMAPGGHAGGFPGTRADKAGHYCIEGLPLGRYILSGDDQGLGAYSGEVVR